MILCIKYIGFRSGCERGRGEATHSQPNLDILELCGPFAALICAAYSVKKMNAARYADLPTHILEFVEQSHRGFLDYVEYESNRIADDEVPRPVKVGCRKWIPDQRKSNNSKSMKRCRVKRRVEEKFIDEEFNALCEQRDQFKLRYHIMKAAQVNQLEAVPPVQCTQPWQSVQPALAVQPQSMHPVPPWHRMYHSTNSTPPTNHLDTHDAHCAHTFSHSTVEVVAQRYEEPSDLLFDQLFWFQQPEYFPHPDIHFPEL